MFTAQAATILIVDDAPENLMVLTDLLTPVYRVLAAQGARSACASPPAPPDRISSCWM